MNSVGVSVGSLIVLGNMGTPLMWMGCGHLVFLNLLLGLGEGSLLARWGKTPRPRAIWLMIAANYISAWLGYLVLPPLLGWLGHDLGSGPLLYRVEWVLVAAVGVAVVVTIVLEAPFVVLALRRSPRSVGQRVGAAVWVQLVSYTLLILMYLLISPMSVITRCERVRDLTKLNPPAEAWVYFEYGESVWRSRLDGSGREHVMGMPGFSRQDDWWDGGLWARMSEEEGLVEILRSMRGGSTIVGRVEYSVIGDRSEHQGSEGPATTWSVDFRPVEARPDLYTAFPLAEMGLVHREWYSSGDERFTRDIFAVNFANPLMRWRAGYPTILPGGLVVFELGGQVMLMDKERRIGVIAEGRSPVVVMEKLDVN